MLVRGTCDAMRKSFVSALDGIELESCQRTTNFTHLVSDWGQCSGAVCSPVLHTSRSGKIKIRISEIIAARQGRSQLSRHSNMDIRDQNVRHSMTSQSTGSTHENTKCWMPVVLAARTRLKPCSRSRSKASYQLVTPKTP